MTHYPCPGWYLKNCREAFRITREGGMFLFGKWPQRRMNAETWRREFLGALDRRINAKGGLWDIGRKKDPDYQTDLRRDADDLRRHLRDRVRIYQFRTPDFRRRFAHHLASYDE